MPFGWVLLDLLTRKIKLRCMKNTLRYITSLNGKDPDPYQSEKHDPDPYQKGVLRSTFFG